MLIQADKEDFGLLSFSLSLSFFLSLSLSLSVSLFPSVLHILSENLPSIMELFFFHFVCTPFIVLCSAGFHDVNDIRWQQRHLFARVEREIFQAIFFQPPKKNVPKSCKNGFIHGARRLIKTDLCCCYQHYPEVMNAPLKLPKMCR